VLVPGFVVGKAGDAEVEAEAACFAGSGCSEVVVAAAVEQVYQSLPGALVFELVVADSVISALAMVQTLQQLA
jgi:hypothetical protein